MLSTEQLVLNCHSSILCFYFLTIRLECDASVLQMSYEGPR
jgi:hypothetical protein